MSQSRKYIVCCLLALCLGFSAVGCVNDDTRLKDSVQIYPISEMQAEADIAVCNYGFRSFDANGDYLVLNTGARGLYLLNGHRIIKAVRRFQPLRHFRIVDHSVYMIVNGEFGTSLSGIQSYDWERNKFDVILKDYYCSCFEADRDSLYISVAPERMGIAKERIKVPSGVYRYDFDTKEMSMILPKMTCNYMFIFQDKLYLQCETEKTDGFKSYVLLQYDISSQKMLPERITWEPRDNAWFPYSDEEIIMFRTDGTFWKYSFSGEREHLFTEETLPIVSINGFASDGKTVYAKAVMQDASFQIIQIALDTYNTSVLYEAVPRIGGFVMQNHSLSYIGWMDNEGK